MNENNGTSLDEEEAILGLVDAFALQWTTQPSLEAVLAAADPNLRARLLQPLLEQELSYRHLRGATPTEAELFARFPGENEAINAARRAIEIDFAQEPMKELKFGQYVAESRVGRGGMGIVWKARLKGTGELVALKSISRAFSEVHNERLKREIQILKSLNDSHIVSVIDDGIELGKPYYVMLLFESGSFDKVVARENMAPRRVAEYLTPVVRALAKAHVESVLHRDIKPSNLLFDEVNQSVLLADFGLASSIEFPGSTESGVVLGTREYMAPEQLKSAKNADERSDVYGMGATLYQLVTGQRPFGDLSGTELEWSIEKVDPQPAWRLNRDIERDLSAIIEKCLQKEPRRRYQSADELADDLQRFGKNLPVAARSATNAERFVRKCRRYPVVTLLLTSLVIALVGSSIGSFRNGWLADANAKLAEQRKSAIATSNANERKAATEALRANREADKAVRQAKLVKRHLYAAHMNLAQAAWDNSRVGQTVRLLELYRQGEVKGVDSDDFRDFEWTYWERRCHSDILTLTGHANGVSSVAYSPDGLRLASASRDGTVKLWDANAGGESRTLKGHTNWVEDVRFSPVGARLASGGRDKTARIWDTITGEEIHTLNGHSGEIWGVAFSPDGQRLASASLDKTVKVWDAITGQELLTFKGHLNGVTNVAFSPEGKMIASTGYGGLVKVWNAANGDELLTFMAHSNLVNGVGFSPDGRLLVTASVDNTARVWDAATGSKLLTLFGHTGGGITDVAFSVDGTRLATAGSDQTIKVWDSSTGQSVLSLNGHSSAVYGVAFSPDGQRLASAGSDQTVKVWDALKDQETITLQGHASWVTDVAYRFDGQQLASASWDGTVKVWNLSTGQMPLTMKGHTGNVYRVAYSPDGRQIASAGSDKTVRVWDAVLERELLTLKGHSDQVSSVAYSPDGQRLASASRDETIKVWEAATGRELLTFRGHRNGIADVVFSPNGRSLASAGNDKTVKLWNAGTGQELFTLVGHADVVRAVTFSLDGRRLASASHDGTVKLWDTSSGRVIWTLKGHTDEVEDIAFSPNGQRLASASQDATVKLWDAGTGQEVLTLKGHLPWVMSVTFSPDGKQLGSSSSDGTVKLWGATPRGKQRGDRLNSDSP